jgi:hypothetical protein
MIGTLALKHWRMVLIAGSWAAIALLWALLAHSTGREHKLQADLAKARADASQAIQSRDAEARARQTDAIDAKRDYEALQTTCRADLALAIKQGRTIERIIRTPAGSAGRGLIGADQLRDVIGQD